jgi:hypothetical protein
MPCYKDKDKDKDEYIKISIYILFTYKKYGSSFYESR